MGIVKETPVSPPAAVGVFDIGSNSIKMTVARPDDDGGVDEFHWRSATVRLGAGIEETGELAPDRIEAAMAALVEFAAEAWAAGAGRLIGVATEATRVAANGEAFLQRVRDEAGIELQAISGDREAELTFRGLAATLDLDGDIVVADIGGGSTEVIVAVDGTFKSGRSIPLGSGRLTDRFIEEDPPMKEELAACHDAATAALHELDLGEDPIDRLIAVGGTGEHLMKLLSPDQPASIEEVDKVLDRLTTLTAADLAEMVAVPEARARVLPAGIAIVRALAELTQPRAIEGARSGIRTGLLLAAFAGEI